MAHRAQSAYRSDAMYAPLSQTFASPARPAYEPSKYETADAVAGRHPREPQGTQLRHTDYSSPVEKLSPKRSEPDRERDTAILDKNSALKKLQLSTPTYDSGDAQQAEVEMLRQQLRVVTTAHQDCDNTKRRLENDLAALTKQQMQASGKLAEQENITATLVEENARLVSHQQGLLNAARSTLADENRGLKQKLADMTFQTGQSAQLARDLQALQSEYSRFKAAHSECDWLHADVEQLANKIGAISELKETLRVQLDDARSEIARLKSNARNAPTVTSADASRQVSSALAEGAALQRQLHAKDALLDEIKRELKSKSAKVTSLEAQIGDMEAHQYEASGLQKRLDQSNEDCRALEQVIGSLKFELDEASRQIAVSKMNMTADQRKHSDLAGQVADLQAQIDLARGEKLSVLERLKEQETEAARLNAALKAAPSPEIVAQLKSETASSVARVRELEAEVGAAEVYVHELQAALMASKKVNIQLDKELARR